jgi:hypothetical protein
MKKETGGDVNKNNFLVQSPFLDSNGRVYLDSITKDGRFRRGFALTKFQMVVYSPEELIAAYTPEVDKADEGIEITLQTATKSPAKGKGKATVKAQLSTYDPEIDSRHIRCFEVSRHECYELFHTKRWSREAVLEVCKENSETLTASQYGSIARAIFDWIEENFTQNEGLITNRSGWG